jgi:hypothetical protein
MREKAVNRRDREEARREREENQHHNCSFAFCSVFSAIFALFFALSAVKGFFDLGC